MKLKRSQNKLTTSNQLDYAADEVDDQSKWLDMMPSQHLFAKFIVLLLALLLITGSVYYFRKLSKVPTQSENVATDKVSVLSGTANSRDKTRRQRVLEISGKIEEYYNEHEGYPGLNDISNIDWAKTNLPTLSQESLKDISGRRIGMIGSEFVYTNDSELGRSNSLCESPTNKDNQRNSNISCQHFSITINNELSDDTIINSKH